VSVEGTHAESVGEFQPRVALWQPWVNEIILREFATLKELRRSRREALANAFSVYIRFHEPNPGLPKRNPGLELANAFSVDIRFS